MSGPRVLVGCERSGKVRDAFLRRGIEAVSCDICPSTAPGPHIEGDLIRVIGCAYDAFDVLIAFPPCTYLSVSGMHWTRRGLRDPLLTEHALGFVRALMGAGFRHWAIENPVGVISSRIRKPDQTIQPYQFGHDASKRTCLWLHNLPRLRPTGYVEPRMVGSSPRWANQTDSGQNRLSPGATRADDRAETYDGVAEAMAAQWGDFLKGNR